MEDSGQQAQVLGEVGHPPPSEVGHINAPRQNPPLLGKEPQDRSRNNTSSELQRCDDTLDNITIVKPRPTTITVNGVPLMDVQMRRRLARVSKATPNKRKLETVKKNRKTTTPSVANNKKIWEYMIEKKARIEDNKDRVDDDDQVPASSGEDNVVNKPSVTTAPTKTKNECDDSRPSMKKTFGTTVKKNNNVSDRIHKFQDLVNGDECVVRSGFCVTHNLKTIREIVCGLVALTRMIELGGG